MSKSTANKTVFGVVTALFSFACAMCLVASPGKCLTTALSEVSDNRAGFMLFSGPTLPPGVTESHSVLAFSGPTLPPGPYDDNGDDGDVNSNSIAAPDDDDDTVEIASSPTLPPGPYDDNGNGMPNMQRRRPQGGDSDEGVDSEDDSGDDDVSLAAGRAAYSRTTRWA